MRKGESLESYEARSKAEAELPSRLSNYSQRIDALTDKIKQMISDRKEGLTIKPDEERQARQ